MIIIYMCIPDALLHLHYSHLKHTFKIVDLWYADMEFKITQNTFSFVMILVYAFITQMQDVVSQSDVLTL